MRIKISATGLYTYPDLTIVCGPARFDDKQHDVLLNPTVLCEVLSPATEAYDRGKKFRALSPAALIDRIPVDCTGCQPCRALRPSAG
ncbi:Uma2 family endonuclease [Candidatus Amarolinea dominans]|uniref:Uma2 family endonuclease n=1 Tax=Candidatus Amarolinea dominans TaxID=3140696 RepID=UPI0031CC8770